MPQAVIVQDWAREPWTATPDDLAPVAGHPDYRPLAIPSGAWSDRLILAGTEVAPGDGGLVEGALAAAEAAASALARPAIRPAV